MIHDPDLRSRAFFRRIQFPRKDERIWDLWTQDERLEWPTEVSQEEYIEILFADCGFVGAQKRAWLKAEYGKAYPDELPPAHKHQVIERLKALRAAQREAEQTRAREASGEQMLPGMEEW